MRTATQLNKRYVLLNVKMLIWLAKVTKGPTFALNYPLKTYISSNQCCLLSCLLCLVCFVVVVVVILDLKPLRVSMLGNVRLLVLCVSHKSVLTGHFNWIECHHIMKVPKTKIPVDEETVAGLYCQLVLLWISQSRKAKISISWDLASCCTCVTKCCWILYVYQISALQRMTKK